MTLTSMEITLLEFLQGRDSVFNSLLNPHTQRPLCPVFGRPCILASLDDDKDEDLASLDGNGRWQ